MLEKKKEKRKLNLELIQSSFVQSLLQFYVHAEWDPVCLFFKFKIDLAAFLSSLRLKVCRKQLTKAKKEKLTNLNNFMQRGWEAIQAISLCCYCFLMLLKTIAIKG